MAEESGRVQEFNYMNIETIKELIFTTKKWKLLLLGLLMVLLCGSIFFFVYYRVEEVMVMNSNYLSESEIREMVLKGPFAGNSVLAPIFCSVDDMKEEAFINGITVKALDRNTLCIVVNEETPVGCVPFLDGYVYFDKEGIFIDSSVERDEKIPYYKELNVSKVIKGEKIPIKGKTVLNSAVIFSRIFQKNEIVPDYIVVDSAASIVLYYGNITVMLGKEQYLEDKMASVLAILPNIEADKAIVHAENVTENAKRVTVELIADEYTSENWPGGYEINGTFTGTGEYSATGKYVGPKPLSEYDFALAAWPGGYDVDGYYNGWSPYDKNGAAVGYMPTPESIAANGDWLGGYDEDGRYVTDGEYDRFGNHIGPKPSDETEGENADEESYGDSYENSYEDSYGDSYEDSYNNSYNDSYSDSYNNSYQSYSYSYGYGDTYSDWYNSTY